MSLQRMLMRVSAAQAASTLLIVAIAYAFRERAVARDELLWPFVIAVLVPAAAYALLERRPLDSVTPVHDIGLAAAYRVRFFLALGLAQAPALFGAAGMFVTSRTWLLVLGTLVSAVLLARNAPTAANVGRDERRLRARGSDGSLAEALRRAPDDRP